MRALLKTIQFFSLCIILLPFTSLAAIPTFMSSEHLALGDDIAIFFNENEPITGHTFSLSNSLSVSYGDLVLLGDFYGDPDKAISLGESKQEREKRFLFAFNMFATNSDYVSEAKKIMQIIHDEQQYVLEAIDNGAKPEDVYQHISDETDRQLNCITGGGCSEKTWWLKPGRYLKLAEYDYDHFGDNALIAYQTGHDLAVQQAILAGKNHDTKALELAYAMNAFASHFLSDRFSAGHIRTPRKELNDNVTTTDIGATLASYMHKEENEYGVRVHNEIGDNWISYGDRSYFSDKNSNNRIKLKEALQSSVLHIFSAYQTGSNATDLTSRIIPYANEIGYDAKQDVSQLFYLDLEKNTLMRRADMNNVYDRNWTANWWGWSTLLELRKQRGMPITLQRKLALSHYKDRAIQDGLITDKDILNVVK